MCPLLARPGTQRILLFIVQIQKQFSNSKSLIFTTQETSSNETLQRLEIVFNEIIRYIISNSTMIFAKKILLPYWSSKNFDGHWLRMGSGNEGEGLIWCLAPETERQIHRFMKKLLYQKSFFKVQWEDMGHKSSDFCFWQLYRNYLSVAHQVVFKRFVKTTQQASKQKETIKRMFFSK